MMILKDAATAEYQQIGVGQCAADGTEIEIVDGGDAVGMRRIFGVDAQCDELAAALPNLASEQAQQQFVADVGCAVIADRDDLDAARLHGVVLRHHSNSNTGHGASHPDPLLFSGSTSMWPP